MKNPLAVNLTYKWVDLKTLSQVPEKIYQNFANIVEDFKKKCVEPKKPERLCILILRYTNNSDIDIVQGIIQMKMIMCGWGKLKGDLLSSEGGFPLPILKKRESEEVILLVMSGIPSIELIIEKALYTDERGKTHSEFDGHRRLYVKSVGNFFVLSKVEQDLENLSKKSEEYIEYIQREIGIENYYLIRNYLDLPLYARGITLRILFDAIEDIDAEKSKYPFKGDEKLKVKHMLQLDIISKIMMLIEDLGAFAVAFKEGPKNLSKIVLSRRSTSKIHSFFQNLERINGDELLDIMGFPVLDKLSLNKEERQLVKKVMSAMADDIRRGLLEIRDFRNQHITVYNKYKHGFTVTPYAEKTPKSILLTADFESVMVVVHDKNKPIENVLPVPHSKRILESYKIIIGGVQMLLKDMLENHWMKIDHQMPNYLPPRVYGMDKLSSEDLKKYRKIVEKLQPKPRIPAAHEIAVHTDLKKEWLKWYLSLDDFLARGKERAQKMQKVKEDIK